MHKQVAIGTAVLLVLILVFLNIGYWMLAFTLLHLTVTALPLFPRLAGKLLGAEGYARSHDQLMQLGKTLHFRLYFLISHMLLVATTIVFLVHFRLRLWDIVKAVISSN